MRISSYSRTACRHDILRWELKDQSLGTSRTRWIQNKSHIDISLNDQIRVGLRNGMTVNNSLCTHFELASVFEKG
jgi:hypothetical protein